MRGHWIGIFSKDGSGTKIEFTEEVEMTNPIMNLFVKSYLKKQQATYVADLKKVLGEKTHCIFFRRWRDAYMSFEMEFRDILIRFAAVP